MPGRESLTLMLSAIIDEELGEIDEWGDFREVNLSFRQIRAVARKRVGERNLGAGDETQMNVE